MFFPSMTSITTFTCPTYEKAMSMKCFRKRSSAMLHLGFFDSIACGSKLPYQHGLFQGLHPFMVKTSKWSCIKLAYRKVSRQHLSRVLSATSSLSLKTGLWRIVWPVRSSVDGNSTNSSSGATRLIKVLQTFRSKLNVRIQKLRENLPMKFLFFLVGFYCATVFSTAIGQTGDWDILSAALAVFVVEGIGALMYSTPAPLLKRIRSLITMFNYWKAGLALGLFLDSFKFL